MKGLLIWAQSACRSQMALYRALGQVLNVPVEVVVWYFKEDPCYIDNRNAVGFRDDEFSDMTIYPVGEDFARGRAVLDSHCGWTHLFCNYQGSANFRRQQLEAARRGEHTAIGSESPCNMFCGGKRLLKEIYFRTKLPWMLKDVIQVSEFFINYSGNDDKKARMIGWAKEKIIPFGYFPPPLIGSKRIHRESNTPFEILATGELTWHRGSDILIRALSFLKEWKVPYHACVTQDGPLRRVLEDESSDLRLNIDFVGPLSMEALQKKYERCSVYVAAGRCEPWGMRLNDALNCGSPIIVSRGMGGVKMVDDYQCGLSFLNEDPLDLARQLARLATERDLYSKCADNAIVASDYCSPENKAKELVSIIYGRFPNWFS